MIKFYYKINSHKYELDWITVYGFFYRLRTKFKPGGFIQKKIDKIMDYIHNEKIVKRTLIRKLKGGEGLVYKSYGICDLVDGLDEVKIEESSDECNKG